jgi:hypothetical protein
VILPGALGSDFAPQDFESNVGVFRARREMGQSFIGAMATLKENEGRFVQSRAECGFPSGDRARKTASSARP